MRKRTPYEDLSEEAKERSRAASKAYYYANRERMQERSRNYTSSNRDYYAQKNREWRKRMHDNPEYRLLDSVRTAFKRGLKSQGVRKSRKVLSSLPYTVNELRTHLESQFRDGMSWENYGNFWHIDHIVPLAALPFKTLDEPNFHTAWGLSNLRPLPATENFKKGSYHDGIRWSYDYAHSGEKNSPEKLFHNCRNSIDDENQSIASEKDCERQ